MLSRPPPAAAARVRNVRLSSPVSIPSSSTGLRRTPRTSTPAGGAKTNGGVTRCQRQHRDAHSPWRPGSKVKSPRALVDPAPARRLDRKGHQALLHRGKRESAGPTDPALDWTKRSCRLAWRLSHKPPARQTVPKGGLRRPPSRPSRTCRPSRRRRAWLRWHVFRERAAAFPRRLHATASMGSSTGTRPKPSGRCRDGRGRAAQ